MQTIVTIGLDIAKSVFQVHGVDAVGDVVIRRQLKRRSVLAFFEKLSPCLVGIEACASSHHWEKKLSRFVPGRLFYHHGADRRPIPDGITSEIFCSIGALPALTPTRPIST